jgi:transcriptional regulator with XRE-family HTH domain
VSIVGKRLRQARERAGISQKQLGVKAGIDPGVASARINQYEKGKHVPDIQTVQRLAEVLEVPPPYLYAEDDQLAVWILAYPRVTPAVRRKVARTVTE